MVRKDRKIIELVEQLESKAIDKEAIRNIQKLTDHVAKLEVMRAVRQNLQSVSEYWKYRMDALRAGGIAVETHTELMDYGDVLEFRIAVRIPEDAPKTFIDKRRLFYRLVKILSQRGTEFLEQVLGYKTQLAVFPKNVLRVSDEIAQLESKQETEGGESPEETEVEVDSNA